MSARPIDTIMTALERAGCKLTREGDGWRTSCPSPRHPHGNKRSPALSISEGADGRALLCCHAGCSVDDVLGALGLEPSALFPDAEAKTPRDPRKVVTREQKPRYLPGEPVGKDGVTRFPYRDATGRTVIFVRRIEEGDPDPETGKRAKRFIQYHYDGKGWLAGLGPWKERPRPLFRLPFILKHPDAPVVMHEGEKAALAALKARLHGEHTTTIGGAGNAHKSDFTPLEGRAVFIVPDADEAGEKHARQVARLAHEAGAAKVAIVTLPDVPEKGDVVEWLEAGGTPESWRALLAKAQPFTAEQKREGGEVVSLEAARADDWPEPEPLPAALAPVPKFAEELLPDAMRGFVFDIAERMQCPADFPAVALMVSLGALIGRRCGIHPKRRDDWLVVPNLWGCVVGKPSLMKSPAIQEAMRPLDALASKASEEYAEAFARYEVEKEAHAARREEWKQSVRKAVKEGRDATGMTPPEPPREPVERRFRTSAATVECLIKLLQSNPAGLLVFRDELTGWLQSLNKPGREGDRQFYLEAWNGGGTGFDYDTLTHGHLRCESLCLSLLGSIQPGPLSRIIADAADGFGDDGLIQRFQLMVYPDVSKGWRNVDRWPETEARKRVRRIFETLDGMTFPVADGERLPALRFENAAQELFDEWRAELEAKLRQDEAPLVESHLAKYRSLMPSLALLMHLAQTAANGDVLRPVTAEAAARAAEWCDYLEAHARRVYGMGVLAEVDGARHLLRRLLAGDVPETFKARDVYRGKHWSGLATPEAVRAACRWLEEYGWLRSEEVASGTRGGRPTVTYTLNPKAAETGARGQGREGAKLTKPPSASSEEGAKRRETGFAPFAPSVDGPLGGVS